MSGQPQPTLNAPLGEWLEWIGQTHPREIELGLSRIRRIWHRLHPGPLAATVITVGGTNGKGSCVALLEAILIQAGYRTGTYTSPHLIRFNERIRIDAVEVADRSIVTALDRVASHLGESSLTYFEFSTLAALWLFALQRVEVVILEVGLGGREDAVNIIDPDVALVTSIGLDHTDWLGATVEAIAIEKAGIFRPNRPAIFAGAHPPATLLRDAEERGIPLQLAGRDYTVREEPGGWSIDWGDERMSGLPPPALHGVFQRANAAGAITALRAIRSKTPVAEAAIRRGLEGVSLAGRMQRIAGQPGWLLDVAHNPEAARELANCPAVEWPVAAAIFSILADKPVREVVEALAHRVTAWYVAPLPSERSLTAAQLAEQIRQVVPEARVYAFDRLIDALQGARDEALPDDTLLVFGSFLTVGGALAWLTSGEAQGRPGTKQAG